MNQALLFNRQKSWKASWSDVWSINPPLHSAIKPTHKHLFMIRALCFLGHQGALGRRKMIHHTPMQKKLFSLFDSSQTFRLTTFIFHQAKHGEDVFLRKGQIPNSLNILTCYQWVSIDCLSCVQGVVALEVTRKRLNEISFSNVPAFWIRNKFNTFRDG